MHEGTNLRHYGKITFGGLVHIDEPFSGARPIDEKRSAFRCLLQLGSFFVCSFLSIFVHTSCCWRIGQLHGSEPFRQE